MVESYVLTAHLVVTLVVPRVYFRRSCDSGQYSSVPSYPPALQVAGEEGARMPSATKHQGTINRLLCQWPNWILGMHIGTAGRRAVPIPILPHSKPDLQPEDLSWSKKPLMCV